MRAPPHPVRTYVGRYVRTFTRPAIDDDNICGAADKEPKFSVQASRASIIYMPWTVGSRRCGES